MFPYARLNEILNMIQSHQDIVTAKQLAAKFQISERTLRSDIQNINMIIEQHGGKLLLKRKEGYYLSIQDSIQFTSFLQAQQHLHAQHEELDTADKRIQYILKTLLYESEYHSQEDLADLVYVSKNTIANYLKTSKAKLHEHHLCMESKANLGVRILGTEEDKRAFIMESLIPHTTQAYAIGFTPVERTLFSGIDLNGIEDIVLAYAFDHEIQFADFNLKNLILHFALLISRLSMDCPLREDDRLIDEEAANDILPLITQIEAACSIRIPKSERQYMLTHFISNSNSTRASSKHTAYLNTLVQQLLSNIYQNYHFDLQQDTLLIADLRHHFQSIINSKQYHLNKRNPLLNTIKANYPLAFEITLTAIDETFQHEPYTLNEDEIGYVSLHIGAAIERCFHASIEKKSVIIVCGSGYATSRMLEAKLTTIFKDKINILGCFSYNEYQQNQFEGIDFVISTIAIEPKDVPVVIVDFSLYPHDIENITKTLATRDDQKNKVDKFFDQRLFLQKKSYSSKSALLHDMCELLRENGYVEAEFERSVRKRESIAATNMDEVLAIPHPLELCATETKVVTAILDEPLLWNENASVRIILLLSIKKNEHDDIEHLYDTFIQIMNDSPLQSLLMKCKDYSEFLHILHTQTQFD